VFVQVNAQFDESDDIQTVLVRYVNPQNENDWGYDVLVLHETSQPSLIYWQVERVFSTHHELFSKRPLIP